MFPTPVTSMFDFLFVEPRHEGIVSSHPGLNKDKNILSRHFLLYEPPLYFLHSSWHDAHELSPCLGDDDVLLNPDPASTCNPRWPSLPAPDKSLPAVSPLNWLILSATMNLLSSGSARARSMRKSMK